MKYVRQATIGLLSGVVGGIVWGILARIAMRIVALAAHQPTEFSVEGTVGILVIGAIFGGPLGIIFAAARRWFPDSGPQAGLLYGGTVLLLLGIPFYLGPLSEEGRNSTRLLAVGMFAVLFIVFGAVVAPAYHWLERRLFGGVRIRLEALPSLIFLITTITIEAVVFGVLIVGVGA